MEENSLPERWKDRWNDLADGRKDTIIGFLGLRIEEADGERIVMTMEADDRHLNPLGIVHGGVTATLLDSVMGCAVYQACPGAKSVTTNLNVHYMAPLQKGRITATARVEHRSRSTLTVTGKVMNDQGEMCALATGSFRLIR